MAQGSGHFLIGHVCSVLFVQRRKREKKHKDTVKSTSEKTLGSYSNKSSSAAGPALPVGESSRSPATSPAPGAHPPASPHATKMCPKVNHLLSEALALQLRKRIPRQPPLFPFPRSSSALLNFLQGPPLCGPSFTF